MPFIERPFRLTAEGVDWDDILGKPNQFPPEAHAHSAADITSGRFGLSRLPDGPSGKVLVAQGIGNDPIWDDVPGAGPHAQTHAWNGSDPISPASILALDCEYTSRTIYVDSQYGSDASGNGSQSAPFQTVAKALSTVRSAIVSPVTVTIKLIGRGPDYPYTIPSFSRLCIGGGAIVFEGDLSVQDSGNVTGGDPTTITDSTKNWTPNQWAGKLVRLVRSGTEYWRLIQSNTQTSLTVIGRLEITPQSGDTYAIYDWSTYLSNSTMGSAMGNVVLRNLACISLSGLRLFWLEHPVRLTLERIWVRAAGPGSEVIYVAGSPTIYCRWCFFDGNGQSHRALSGQGSQGMHFHFIRSWSRGWTSAPNLWIGGAGTVGVICNGSILDGPSTVLRVCNEAFANFYADPVSGAFDKITIQNGSTYGLRLTNGAGAIFTGTAYVNYVNNGMDRSADTTSWYFDSE